MVKIDSLDENSLILINECGVKESAKILYFVTYNDSSESRHVLIFRKEESGIDIRSSIQIMEAIEINRGIVLKYIDENLLERCLDSAFKDIGIDFKTLIDRSSILNKRKTTSRRFMCKLLKYHHDD
jgi:hypothetical protein